MSHQYGKVPRVVGLQQRWKLCKEQVQQRHGGLVNTVRGALPHPVHVGHGDHDGLRDLVCVLQKADVVKQGIDEPIVLAIEHDDHGHAHITTGVAVELRQMNHYRSFSTERSGMEVQGIGALGECWMAKHQT
jgi:hypothetical protein